MSSWCGEQLSTVYVLSLLLSGFEEGASRCTFLHKLMIVIFPFYLLYLVIHFPLSASSTSSDSNVIRGEHPDFFSARTDYFSSLTFSSLCGEELFSVSMFYCLWHQLVGRERQGLFHSNRSLRLFRRLYVAKVVFCPLLLSVVVQ